MSSELMKDGAKKDTPMEGKTPLDRYIRALIASKVNITVNYDDMVIGEDNDGSDALCKGVQKHFRGTSEVISLPNSLSYDLIAVNKGEWTPDANARWLNDTFMGSNRPKRIWVFHSHSVDALHIARASLNAEKFSGFYAKKRNDTFTEVTRCLTEGYTKYVAGGLDYCQLHPST